MKRVIAAVASLMIALGLCITTSSAHATVPNANGQIVHGRALWPSEGSNTFTINPEGTHEIYSRTAGCTTCSPDFGATGASWTANGDQIVFNANDSSVREGQLADASGKVQPGAGHR